MKLLSNNFYFLFPCQKIPLHTELHPHAPVCLLYPEGSCCFHQRCCFVCRWNHGPLPHVHGTEPPLSLSPLTEYLILYLKATGRYFHPVSPIAKTEIFKQTILCKPKDQVLRLHSALTFRSVDSNEALTISNSKEFNLWDKNPNSSLSKIWNKVNLNYETPNIQKFCCFFILLWQHWILPTVL